VGARCTRPRADAIRPYEIYSRRVKKLAVGALPAMQAICPRLASLATVRVAT
jgi:hypothetical protein